MSLRRQRWTIALLQIDALEDTKGLDQVPIDVSSRPSRLLVMCQSSGGLIHSSYWQRNMDMNQQNRSQDVR